MSRNLLKNRNVDKRHYVVLSIIFLLSAFLRIWYLDRIPSGIVADETDYVLNAKAIYHTGGSILSQNWSPWSLTTVPQEIPKAEFPYFISIPFVGPFGLSLFTARIGYAAVSILYVFIIFGIAQTLFGFWAGAAAGLLAAINPWSVYYGRTAYDVPIAITGYIAAFYLLIRLKGPKLLWSLIPLCIAFYSYIGTKILFVPYTVFALLGSWLLVHKKTNTKWFVIIGIVSLLVFTNYAIRIQSLGANSRISQIFTPTSKSVVDAVDSQRRLTLTSPLTKLFANKIVVYAKEATIKFAGAFSPTILFTNGEGIATFSLWEHGLFYPLDAIFLILGICTLFTAAPILLMFLLAIIMTSTLPSIMSTVGTTYVHRSSLMYPFFTIIMGYGMVSFLRLIRNQTYKKIGIVLLSLVYVLLIANFVYLYFFRFPFYNSESFGLSQRVYSKYMKLAVDHGIHIDNISATSVVYFRNYIFYNNIPNASTIPAVRTAFETKNFTLGNAVFTKNCPTSEDIAAGKSIYILSDTAPCKKLFINQPMIVIPTLSDGGSLYMIFNDKICTNYALASYPTGFSINDFAIEELSEKQFCERFIIRYSQPLYLPAPEK